MDYESSTDSSLTSREAELKEESDEEMEVEPSGPTKSVSTPSSSSNKSLHHRHDLMMDEGKSHSTFFKQTKSYPMFPCHEEKVKWDDYGEAIR